MITLGRIAMLTLLAAGALVAAAEMPELPENPATAELAVVPETARPGQAVTVTVTLVPAPGIKINRYPKIRLKVPAHDGVTPGAEAAVGNEGPPPPGSAEDNYFKSAADPVAVSLALDPAAAPGKHELSAKVVYFYCVKASGFCTRKQLPLSIPLSVSTR